MLVHDAKARSDAAAVDCRDFDEDGDQIFLVQSQYKDECDLNVIIGRLTPEQLEDRLAAANGVYGDFSDVMSYADAKQLVIDADNAFNMLDAKIRKMFDNDPQALIDYLDDPANDDEAVKLGLKVRVEAEQPLVVTPSASNDEVNT